MSKTNAALAAYSGFFGLCGLALEDFGLEDLTPEDLALEDRALEDLALEDLALEDLALEDLARKDFRLAGFRGTIGGAGSVSRKYTLQPGESRLRFLIMQAVTRSTSGISDPHTRKASSVQAACSSGE